MKKLNLYVLIISLISFSCNKQFKFKDSSEIEQTMQDYRNAWKSGDSTAVLNKLSQDIIIFQPGKTSKPIVGKKQVSDFWFPKSDVSYPIIEYVITNQEINGSDNLAYFQGTSNLTWFTLKNNIPKDTTTSVTEFTTILKKRNNEWKVYRIMYNIKDPKYSR